MIRKIITIDEEKCNGCGLCEDACHEGAIAMIDGKAKLISDEYCDGLGDCLPECPTGAIKLEDKETMPFNKELVEKRMAEIKEQKEKEKEKEKKPLFLADMPPMFANVHGSGDSQLKTWPVQIKLMNTKAGCLKDAHLLVAADCTAYAYSKFHEEFIKDRVVLIGCPKLDDNEFYIEKLTEIFRSNDLKSITVVKMEVPCCNGMTYAVKQAMLKSEKIVPYNEVTITTEGNIL